VPNYKIFQDIPENARVKVYASQSGAATALKMDSGGLITAPYAESSGAMVPLRSDSGGLVVKLYASQSGAITALQMASGALIVSSDIITMDSGTGVAFAAGSSGSGTTVWNVLEYKDWTYAVKKSGGAGTVDVKLQISADGTNWWDQNGTWETIASGAWKYFVTDVFLKYARIAVKNTGGSGGVHWYFQGQRG